MIQKLKSLKSLCSAALTFAKNAQGVKAVQTSARRNGIRRVNWVCIILRRKGMHTMRKSRPHVASRFDHETATALATELRKDGLHL